MTRNIPYSKSSIILFITSLFIISCSADKGGENSDDGNNPSLDFEISSTTSSAGKSAISFQTAKDVTKLLISAKSGKNNSIKFTKVNSSNANYLNPGNEELSLAKQATPIVNSINIPSRSIDEALIGSTKFDVEIEVEGTSIEGDQITFSVSSRADTNFNSGSMLINVFYVGAVGLEETTKLAVKEGLNVAQNILSNTGISTSIVEKDITGPVNLPSPFTGSNIYENASKSVSFPAINLFVGGNIDESSDGTILGISAGIPGPATPSVKSAVVVSIFNSAGADGRFSQEDIRILGETFAHESGHYMGLFHPVDFNGSQVAGTDPLTDTESCSFITDCISRQSLIENLMFASPVADGNGGFVAQNKLTNDQKSVLNRYIAVN